MMNADVDEDVKSEDSARQGIQPDYPISPEQVINEQSITYTQKFQPKKYKKTNKLMQTSLKLMQELG